MSSQQSGYLTVDSTTNWFHRVSPQQKKITPLKRSSENLQFDTYDSI